MSALDVWYELKEDIVDKIHNINATGNNSWINKGPLKCAKFNGLDQFIRIDDNMFINNGTFYNKTICFFFNTNDSQKHQVLFKQGFDLNGLGIYIYENYIYCIGYNRNIGWMGTFFSAYIEQNTWYHITLRITNGIIFEMFLNGKLVNKDEDIRYLTPHTGLNLIGKNDNFNFHDDLTINNINPLFFDGYILDFRYYNMSVSDNFLEEYAKNYLPSTKIVKPDNITSADAHELRLHNFEDTNIYITRPINQLFNMVGSDIVLDGFYITNYELINNELVLNICKGKLIQDLTLIEIFEEPQIKIPIINDGYYILHTEYKYSESYENNPFRLILQFLDSTIYWSEEHTKIILGIFEVRNNNIFLKNHELIINDKIYYIRGINRFNLIDIIFETLRHNQIFTLSERELINSYSVNFNKIINLFNKVLLSENGNLIISDAKPYFNSRYLNKTPNLKNSESDDIYDIYVDNGNLFLLLNNILEEKINPNIKDIGMNFDFLQKEFQLKFISPNLKLENPLNFHLMCT